MQKYKSPTSEQLKIKIDRLRLDAVTSEDLDQVWDLYKDEKLHEHTSFELKASDDVERFRRWTKQVSPDGAETWLNWLTRETESGKTVGHVQVGIKRDGNGYIGYVVSRDFQRQGYATESLRAVLNLLKSLDVQEMCAFVDTRNSASIALVSKLGFMKKELVKNADVIRGEPSDEYVFCVQLNKSR